MSEERRCVGFKLFGVQINVGSNEESLIGKRSNSSGSLDTCETESTSGQERKKGKPWSEEEHKLFLIGLHKLGRGDWKGISKNFVLSRNSSQVASHAQKYFKRMSACEKKRRQRSSVFDISINDETNWVLSQEFPGSSFNKDDESSQPRDSSFTQRQEPVPTFSRAPAVTLPIQSSVSLPHTHRNLINGVNFVPQPSLVRLQHQKSSSLQPSAITPTDK